jgi:hypothetical protein
MDILPVKLLSCGGNHLSTGVSAGSSFIPPCFGTFPSVEGAWGRGFQNLELDSKKNLLQKPRFFGSIARLGRIPPSFLLNSPAKKTMNDVLTDHPLLFT